MGLFTVVIGLLTASFLIFLKNAHHNAHKQRFIARRLHAYLSHWRLSILEHDLFSIYHLGAKWKDEFSELVLSGASAKDLLELEKKNKDFVYKKVEEACDEGLDIPIGKKEKEEILRALPSDFLAFVMSELNRKEQNIIDGKTFISDDEASYLGLYNSQLTIKTKMKLLELTSSFYHLLARILVDSEDFKLEKYKDEVQKIIWKAVMVSCDIERLSTQMDQLTSRSTLDLTIENFGSS